MSVTPEGRPTGREPGVAGIGTMMQPRLVVCVWSSALLLVSSGNSDSRGASMTNFCVLAYVNGKPVSAERLSASSPAEAVKQILQDKQSCSFEIYHGRQVVAVIDQGLITIPGQRD